MAKGDLITMYDFSKLENFIEIPQDKTIDPNLETLNFLIKQYVLHVPFENINVQNRLPLAVNHASMIQKITEHHQGGICYENNRLFHDYLTQYGFEVHFAQATVSMGEKGWAESNVHMTNIVELDGERYLVETGLGASPIMAVPLNGDIVEDKTKSQIFRINMYDNQTFDLERYVNDEWVIQYRVTDRYLKFHDFENAMLYNQTSLESHFVTDPLLVRNWDTGHVTMTGRSLTITEGTQKTKYEVTPDNYRQFLDEYFDMPDVTIKFFEQ